ncbi:MAG TPA: TRAP transporter small permease [Burkholderiaceae bacterium]|jgi:TRAP-type transport system small permease protein|nr:TRAP transporter small permease [Burkholderiaceae bacterium]
MQSAALVRRLEFALGVLAASILFAMMLLTFVDVILRYFFNAPMKGSFEVTELLMAVLIFCGLPLVSYRGGHVAIDTFERFLPRLLRRALQPTIHLVCAIALAGMAWLLAGRAARFAALGDVTQTLKIEIAPWVYLMAALTLATALIHLAAAIALMRAGWPDSATPSGDARSAGSSAV